MSHTTAPIQIKLGLSDGHCFWSKHVPGSVQYPAIEQKRNKILAAAFAKHDMDPGTTKWEFSDDACILTLFAATEVPYVKEFMTCSACHKYKGCWSDSEVCSECDETEDERKMAYNEALEETKNTVA